MPKIRPGRIIIFTRLGRPKAGRLVLARADGQEVVKFIAAEREGVYHLVGALDGSAGYRVERADILGVAVGYNNAYESTRRPAG